MLYFVMLNSMLPFLIIKYFRFHLIWVQCSQILFYPPFTINCRKFSCLSKIIQYIIAIIIVENTCEMQFTFDIAMGKMFCLSFCSPNDIFNFKRKISSRFHDNGTFRMWFLFVCPICLPVFFLFFKWTRIGCMNQSWHGFDPISI